MRITTILAIALVVSMPGSAEEKVFPYKFPKEKPDVLFWKGKYYLYYQAFLEMTTTGGDNCPVSVSVAVTRHEYGGI